MLITRTAGLILAAALFCLPHWTLAADLAHLPKSNADHEIHLSPDLKALLNQEMAAIEKGMMNLIPAISAGEWDTAATIGKNIKDSFIMKQKLTNQQKDGLHRELPPVFIEMDQDFHKSAGMMAHAAEMKNADVVNFYFFKLNDACVACHAKFAAERFPGLATGAGKEGSHH